MILFLLWAIGWFITVAGGAAFMFARFGTLMPQGVRGWGDADAASTPFVGPLVLIVAWPLGLALGLGWLLWPFAAGLLAERERARQS